MDLTLTRRRLLLAGAGTLAAAGLGGALRFAAGAPALAGSRRATYAALADAVATGPAMRLAPGSAAHAADAFAAQYAGWPAQRRGHADGVLDALHRAGPSSFASHDALALAAVTIGPEDDGRAPLAL